MALLKQCFCYSLRQGSFIIGSYSLIVYCVAFAIELWWIAEALVILPAPAYALCGLYFFNFVTAAILLFGLLVRQQKYLMSWTLTTSLSFFPEAGMVLFMSLYYWPTQKYEYGVVELVYWSLRAIFNIFGGLCVVSLYLSWRDEELILERLNDLNLAHLGKPHGVVGFHNTTLKRHSYNDQSRRLSHHSSGHYYPQHKNIALGYHNLGYKFDSPPVSEDVNYLTLRPQQHHQRSRTSQSFTSHANYVPPNQLSQQRRVGSFRPSHTTVNTEHHHHKGQQSQFNTALIFDPTLRKSRISEWGIAGVGIEPPGFPGTYQLQRTKSLWNVSNDDYWARAPPTRPVSMGYVNRTLHDNPHEMNQNRHGGLTTQIVDTGKRRMVRMGGRRAASMDGLNFRYYNQNIMANQLTTDWSKSSLDSGGDEEGYYYYGVHDSEPR